jgi:hypothetical protein
MARMDVGHSFAGRRQTKDRDGLLVLADAIKRGEQVSEPFPGAAAEDCRMYKV